MTYLAAIGALLLGPTLAGVPHRALRPGDHLLDRCSVRSLVEGISFLGVCRIWPDAGYDWAISPYERVSAGRRPGAVDRREEPCSASTAVAPVFVRRKQPVP